MTDKYKVPEIRFKGFSGEWEEWKLGNVAEEYYGGGTPKTSVDDHWNGDIPWIQSSDISEEQLSNIDPRKMITEQGIKSSATKLVPKNSIAIVTRVGVGKLAYMPYNYATSQDFISLSKLKVDSWFATYSIWQKIQSELHSVQGTSIKGITKEELLSKPIMVTLPEKEQSQIGTFFKNLDSLITLHQRKYGKLTTVKKAMLEKMFPKDGADVPEIRFKEFTEKWKKRQLGEIISEERRPIELKDEHEYELVTVKRRNEGVVSRGKLRGKDILVKNYYEVRTGDYIISKRQVVHGANGVVPQSLDKAIVSNEYLVAVGNERINTDFFALFSKLPHMYKKFFLSSYGVDIEKLVFDVDDWKKRYVVVPCLSEQQRISSFFQNIDSLITLQQRELYKLKNIKKACLEKMFV
jgi:type I restriction enzyme, S subunit